MPFETPDDWEVHLFSNINCPDNVAIPVSDDIAWKYNPGYRWTFNKMNLCTIQGLSHGPHGLEPDFYPVFSKPIYNLWGMGMSCQILTDKESTEQNYSPGHFWMELLEGEHCSIDVVMVNGKSKWIAKTVGIVDKNQMMDHWKVNIQDGTELQDIVPESILKHFSSYTGHINFELIGNNAIEIHLRLATEFIVFYGKRWLESIVSLYEKQKWYSVDTTTFGYNFPLFIDSNIIKATVNYELIEELKNNEKILDIQVCIDKNRYVNGSANPSGGNRIAIISSTDLDEALKIREILKESILL